MSKFIVETFYTCTFKITHKLDELNEKKLSELENRNDGEVKVIDVKLNNRKTKTTNQNKGLDVGWHKIAYPANRFRKYTNHKIIPIYLLKWKKIYHLFVFPVFDFHKDGIIINDQYKLKPDRIFSVNFGNSLDNLQ